MSSAATLTKSFLDIAVLGDAYEHSNEMEEQLLNLLIALDSVEMASMPVAFANTLHIMADDLVKWRTLGDLAVRLDMFEVLPSLLADLAEKTDVHQAANALTLAANPAVPAPLRERTHRLITGSKAHSPSRMLQIRAGQLEPQSDLEHVLMAQVWPGSVDSAALAEVTPLIFIARDSTEATSAWHLASAIARSGGRIRWVDERAADTPLTPWASPACLYVHWSGAQLASWRQLIGRRDRLNSLLAPAALDDEVDLSRFIHKIERHLPGDSKFDRGPRAVGTLPNAFSVEGLGEGAYDAAEMSYLGASSRSSLMRMAKDGLQPAHADINRWRFNQLVAIRLVSSFKAHGMKVATSATRLVAQLSDMASAPADYRVGIGTDGEVYLDDGAGFKNARTEQQTMADVLAIDDAFRPFEIGRGKVPGLLRPGRFTTVHPLTLGGTPCIEDRRISARALALAAHNVGSAHLIRSAYPDISGAQIADGISVGDGILSQAA